MQPRALQELLLAARYWVQLSSVVLACIPPIGYSLFYAITRARWELEPPSSFVGVFILEFEVPLAFASAFVGFIFAQAAPDRWSRLMLTLLNLGVPIYWLLRFARAA